MAKAVEEAAAEQAVLGELRAAPTVGVCNTTCNHHTAR